MPNTITPVSPTDLALWRNAPYSFLGYLYVDSPPIIFQARVNLPGGTTYPIQDIPFDSVTVGSHSVLKQNMTVIFESTIGADDRGRQRIRRIDGSTSQIRIGRSSQGTEDGTVVASDNTYITVLDDRRVAPKIPYINPDTLETFKDGDFDFATYGVNQGAVVNLGGGPIWIRLLKPTDSIASLSINSAVDSYGVDGNIVSYANTIGDGTFTSGGSTTAAWTASFPPGRRYISVAITDTNGVVTLRELLVVVLKFGSGFEPITYFKPSGLNPKITGGQTTQFKIYQALSVQSGVLVCYFEREFYGGTEKVLNDQNGFSNIKFIGWYQTDQSVIRGSQKGRIKETTLTCLDINAKLDTLPGFSQEIGRKATPATWQEAKTANLDKFEVLNKRWLDTAMSLTDYHGANQGDVYAFSALGCGEKTRYQQDENLVDSAIAYHAACTMAGRLLLTPDPQVRDDDLATIIELQEGDFSAIRYNGTRPPSYYWERGGCVLTSTAEVDSYIPAVKFAVAPGFTPGWGKNKNDLNQQLGVTVDEIKNRTKKRNVRNNARFGTIEVDLTHPGDFGYDPAYQQWIKLNISASSAAWLGVTWTSQKCLLLQTKITFPFVNNHKTKKVTLVLELQVVATDAGVEEQVQAVDNNPINSQPSATIPILPSGGGLCAGPVQFCSRQNNIGILVSDGTVLRTTNFMTAANAGGPVWTTYSISGLSGTLFGAPGGVSNYTVYAFSPNYVSGSGDVYCWATTTVGIYKIKLTGTPSATLQYTFTATPLFAALDSSFAEDGFAVCTIYYQGTSGHTGTWWTKTMDGTNWSVEVQLTGQYNTDVAQYATCVVVDSNNTGVAYTTAYITTGTIGTSVAKLYKTTDHATTWVQQGGTFQPGTVYGYALEVGFPSGTKYLGTFNGAFPVTDKILRDVGGVITDITPIVAGIRYSSFGRFALSVAVTNNNRLILFGGNENSPFPTALFSSQDQGSTWLMISSGGNTDGGVAIAGDNANAVYFFAKRGASVIKYSTDFGNIFDDRTGNIANSGDTLGIFGF